MIVEREYDVVIIGSGFGGSVSAMRLAEKGYKVAVLEQGRHFRKNDFAKTNWNISRYLWLPFLRCFGIQQISLLKGVMVLHGAGVGGGSLVYANTLMEPRDVVFDDPNWPKGKGHNWKQELQKHFATAKKMLGVTTNKLPAAADQALREVAMQMNCADSYHLTDVGVFFGEPDVEVADPYFGGAGPARIGCTGCGGCMVGCRVGAKNTLDQNYLYFAQKFGAKVFAKTQVDRIVPNTRGGYDVFAKATGSLFSEAVTFNAKKVIVAAGVLGTAKLLFRCREQTKTLPHISAALGERVRTNGESLCGATSFHTDVDYSRGIAIGSAIHPDANTKIEPVRYSAGSNAMALLGLPLVDKGVLPRPLKLLGVGFINFLRKRWYGSTRDWAKQSVILLVMQSIDETMRLGFKRGIFGGKLVGGATDKKIPSYIPLAQQAARIMARVLRGYPQNIISEVLLETPATAHILGGCMMGDDAASGVVDSKHEVFGYPGLYVCDGSVVPVNLGVNPSLTITAMAERFCSFWPAKDVASK